jgi:hypothetical protein
MPTQMQPVPTLGCENLCLLSPHTSWMAWFLRAQKQLCLQTPNSGSCFVSNSHAWDFPYVSANLWHTERQSAVLCEKWLAMMGNYVLTLKCMRRGYWKVTYHIVRSKTSCVVTQETITFTPSSHSCEWNSYAETERLNRKPEDPLTTEHFKQQKIYKSFVCPFL